MTECITGCILSPMKTPTTDALTEANRRGWSYASVNDELYAKDMAEETGLPLLTCLAQVRTARLARRAA